jgi:hypothetical protein
MGKSKKLLQLLHSGEVSPEDIKLARQLPYAMSNLKFKELPKQIQAVAEKMDMVVIKCIDTDGIEIDCFEGM